ncbi:hypothetical protein HYH03_015660 [Edaphochlamys debaryana]|uniref:FAD-binding PCMH-type domain-containing protein n=1 Tax=Edaphochlamys debaryana TaxID=47281 RepID=A0A835XKN6_9CHLO|nr:hypothetical protein HYH03_015660 [Edaphochlamys debaryana]|eukprot:KAG2485596.1 hypothetical protein HYH03_015660 [Edaphochlamys debaryana]
MSPAAIYVVSPDVTRRDDDVKAVIKDAREKKIAIAVRTGGHQYSGASSCGGKNVQLDISKAYKDFIFDPIEGVVTTGVSTKLSALNKMLGEHKVFVPHGQCGHVHAGGHTHTGGYGLPGRAFGLFGDHILAVRAFTADGNVRWIERDATNPADADLFWAILGGSPGNFAIVTHLRLRVHRDEDHPQARGMRLFMPYRKDTLRNLLQIKADMAADAGLPKDYDFCITASDLDLLPSPETTLVDDEDMVLEEEPSIFEKFGVRPEEIKEFEREMDRSKGQRRSPDGIATIIVFAEWANTGGVSQNDYDDKWFKRIRDAGWSYKSNEWDHGDKPMSYLTSQWLFWISREFRMPYNKRTYLTNSTKVNSTGWVDFTTNSINEVVQQYLWGARVVVQIQLYGGKDSRYHIADPNDDNDPRNKTSYSWRNDTTIVQVMDCFYKKKAKAFADAWALSNDAGLIGPKGTFMPNVDRRLLWGSYYRTKAEFNLMHSHLLYHESAAKWERLVEIKKRVDPDNIFTPNDFSVRAQAGYGGLCLSVSLSAGSRGPGGPLMGQQPPGAREPPPYGAEVEAGEGAEAHEEAEGEELQPRGPGMLPAPRQARGSSGGGAASPPSLPTLGWQDERQSGQQGQEEGAEAAWEEEVAAQEGAGEVVAESGGAGAEEGPGGDWNGWAYEELLSTAPPPPRAIKPAAKGPAPRPVAAPRQPPTAASHRLRLSEAPPGPHGPTAASTLRPAAAAGPGPRTLAQRYAPLDESAELQGWAREAEVETTPAPSVGGRSPARSLLQSPEVLRGSPSAAASAAASTSAAAYRSGPGTAAPTARPIPATAAWRKRPAAGPPRSGLPTATQGARRPGGPSAPPADDGADAAGSSAGPGGAAAAGGGGARRNLLALRQRQQQRLRQQLGKHAPAPSAALEHAPPSASEVHQSADQTPLLPPAVCDSPWALPSGPAADPDASASSALALAPAGRVPPYAPQFGSTALLLKRMQALGAAVTAPPPRVPVVGPGSVGGGGAPGSPGRALAAAAAAAGMGEAALEEAARRAATAAANVPWGAEVYHGLPPVDYVPPQPPKLSKQLHPGWLASRTARPELRALWRPEERLAEVGAGLIPQAP